MPINLQNSAASAVHVNNVSSQVQSLTAQCRWVVRDASEDV